MTGLLKTIDQTTEPEISQASIHSLLQTYRSEARTERDKGTYFERFATAFLTSDPVQAEQYESVQPYAEWAKAHGWDGRDTGIDLVAKLRDADGYAAVQCKFYDANYRIQKTYSTTSMVCCIRKTIVPSMPTTCPRSCPASRA